MSIDTSSLEGKKIVVRGELVMRNSVWKKKYSDAFE